MSPSRRSFVRASLLGAAATAVTVRPTSGARSTAEAPTAPAARPAQLADRFDPWIEVEAEALRHNVGQVSRLASERPVLAVVKNNAYGLGLTGTAALLEPMPAIAGFAVVEVEAAIALREAGVRKPVYLMALFAESVAPELARLGIVPCIYSEDAPRLLRAMARAAGGAVGAHVYLDTGMSRMGVPHHRALPWLERVVGSGDARIVGAFCALTEDAAFDREQLRRFTEVTDRAAAAGMPLGVRHVASSSAVFDLPAAHLDMVRPGIALYGGYPNDPTVQRDTASLRCAFRLKARVVRVERLRAGDGVSYGRSYVAERPTWIATLPVGHTDGYPRAGVSGGRVLIGSRTYAVIGAVSASHTIVEVGEEPTVRVGDVATLLGPDDPAVDPNRLSVEAGVSVYDLFMHLDSALPRVVV